jgi:hypothetical protein
MTPMLEIADLSFNRIDDCLPADCLRRDRVTGVVREVLLIGNYIPEKHLQLMRTYAQGSSIACWVDEPQRLPAPLRLRRLLEPVFVWAEQSGVRIFVALPRPIAAKIIAAAESPPPLTSISVSQLREPLLASSSSSSMTRHSGRK